MVGDHDARTGGQVFRIEQTDAHASDGKERPRGPMGDLAPRPDSQRQHDEQEREQAEHQEDQNGINAVDELQKTPQGTLQEFRHWVEAVLCNQRDGDERARQPVSVNWFSLCKPYRGSVITVTPHLQPPPHTALHRIVSRHTERAGARRQAAKAMSTVTKATVYSRTGEDTPETPSLAAIDRFLDAVWMERGLSPNTLSAYRADLTALDRWLQARGGSSLAAKRADVLGVHRLSRRGRRTPTLDRPTAVQLPPLLPLPDSRGCDQGRSDRADRDAEDRPLAAEVADRGRSRSVARSAGDRRSARPSRPLDAGSAVRDRPARLRAREPQGRARST